MTTNPSIKCACEEWMRPACAGNPIYERHKGKPYCVLHFPQGKSHAEFEGAVTAKLASQDYNFSGVSFSSEANFAGYHFKKDAVFDGCIFESEASFYKTIFDGAVRFSSAYFKSELNFSGVTVKSIADFSESTFEAFVDFSASEFELGADFRECTFNGPASFATGFSRDTDFYGADFYEWVEFTDAEFKDGANFIATTFCKQADFTNATFDGEANFNLAVFAESASFGKPDGGREVFGDNAKLSLEYARIDNPHRFSFHSMRLKPGWFFNLDCRKIEFTNVSWFKIGIDENYVPFGEAHKLMRITYRQLAVNAEESHRYREASDFRYLAMDVHRFERAKPGLFQWHKIAFWELTWWYWLASGYGERAFRAFMGLLGIWLLFAVIFTQVGFVVSEKKSQNESAVIQAEYEDWGRPLNFPRAVTYAATVMTLQRPEPRPQTNAAHLLVLLATVSGPIQAALLALAIRRKFIR
jgi:uncharacterized protein YjbI with pentapeptide repeats